MNLPILLLLGGFVVVVWIYLYSRQRASQLAQEFLEPVNRVANLGQNTDGVLVATKQGKLVYANEIATQWLNLMTGRLSLEQVARMAEPSENLLRLFSGAGQSSFQIKNRWVEASSYDLVFEGQDCFVVTIRELSANVEDPDVLNVSNAMALINDINETVNAGMGVDNAIQTILTLVRAVLPYEAAEICLWEEADNALYQRGWVGDSRYLLLLQETGGRYAYGEGISGWIAQYRQPVLINSQHTSHGLQPKLANLPFKSILAVPINLADRFFGTFEVMSLNENAFTQGDQALLQAISKTIATNIHNAQIYVDQVRRIESIATLQQTITSSNHVSNAEQNKQVFGTLCERVAKLVPADMCIIFLYDSDRKGMVTQLPAYGIPDALIRNVFIPMPENSPQYDIFFYQSNWVSNDAVDEPLLQHIGLDSVVRLAGIYNMAWFPLQLAQ
ncbi:MAG: hypothetical protein CUN52_09900, partial [Phototrophicales bacterium]